MVQLRHKASLELYSCAKEKCISRPTIHNPSKLQLSETQFQHKMLAAKANFEAELILLQIISQGCINALTASLDMIQYHRMLAWTPKWPSLILKRLISSIHSSTQSLQSSFNLPRLPIPPSTICDITISESDV